MLITDSCYNQNKKRKDLKNTTTAHIQALFLHATSNHSFVEQPLKCVVVIKIIGKGRKTGGGGKCFSILDNYKIRIFLFFKKMNFKCSLSPFCFNEISCILHSKTNEIVGLKESSLIGYCTNKVFFLFLFFIIESVVLFQQNTAFWQVNLMAFY